MVGCVSSWWLNTWNSFKWNIWLSGHCTEFTAYGNNNSNSIDGNTGHHNIYYCTTGTEYNKSNIPKVVNKDCWKIWSQQSYGQYAALFTNVKGDTDSDGNPVWDSDDENLWSGNVNAIEDADNVQELYLISNDGKTRLFFRRNLKRISDDWLHHQYVIQMLRLRWFDAWSMHNFDSPDKKGMYDWKIDTWACDAWMGFVCGGAAISWTYEGYNLPKDADDGWIDIIHGPINVYTRNLSVSPVVSPDLSWAKAENQINPYVRFLSVFWIYVPYYSGRMADSIVNFKVPIQTTINTKKFYKEPKS